MNLQPTYQKHVNQHVKHVNLFLNQTLPKFLLYVKQTWVAQLILVIFLGDFIFL